MPLARLIGMTNDNRSWFWVAAIVIGHLIISMAHGAAHAGAHVPMSSAANLFVFIVILAGPLAGFAVMFAAPRVGSLMIAVALGGSLVFGLVNHFIFVSPDHVTRVASEWRLLFGGTAVLLGVTEALGAALAIRLAYSPAYSSRKLA
jgi:hypothetical protein